MALSFVQYTGDGSTTTFAVPFPYIAQTHIQVKVDGVLKTASTDYTFPTTSTLQFTTAPLNGLIVEIRRVTPRTNRLVDFQDASTLTEATLDQDSNQNFFVAQEAFDLTDSNIKLAPDNTFDAEGLRIKNLGAPTLPTDAVRLQDLPEDWNGTESGVGIVASEAYIAPTLLNGWVNYGPGGATVGYFKDRLGIVHLKGLVGGGVTSDGIPIFKLPPGYRPLEIQHFTCTSNHLFGDGRVSSNGDVEFARGSSAWFSLDMISFRAEQ